MGITAADRSASNFCSHVMTEYSLTIAHKQVGSVQVLVALLYIITSVVLLGLVGMQSYLAKQSPEYLSATVLNSMIFPVFINILYFNTLINLIIGLAYLFFDYALTNQNNLGSVIVFSLVWGLQHFLLEGVAFLLMGKGLGVNSAQGALRWALIWGLITAICEGVINSNIAIVSNVVEFVWDAALLTFYFLLWVMPQRRLFRRPAAIVYAKFWCLFRLVVIAAHILELIGTTSAAGNCVNVFGTLVGFTLFEPLILYYTLLQDSRWWQGLNIQQGKRTRSAETIRSPLEGVDLNPRSAQALAYNVDAIGSSRGGPGNVKLLNFAYISLEKSCMLGSGSFSKVYKGRYKRDECAIKLIFTVDLTTDIIRRVCAEAEILSNFKHPNIVHIFGVAVLPPSVCIALELCVFGSLADVVRGLTIEPPVMSRVASAESGDTLTGSNNSNAKPAQRNKDTTKSASQFVLSTADRLYLACGCARGVAALHAYASDLCHRDIKSFNFLVDGQFNAKLADLELGVTDHTNRGNSKDRNAFEKRRPNNSNNNSTTNSTSNKRNNWGSFIMNVSSSGDSSEDLEAGVAAGVLAADEFLANWAAPEVITNGIHQQASDVYSLSLVLWEIITGVVPFNEESKQDDIRSRVLSGERPLFPSVVGTLNTSEPWHHYCSLIERGWQHEPLARPTAMEILSELECMWKLIGNKIIFDTEVNVDLQGLSQAGERKMSIFSSSKSPSPDQIRSQKQQILEQICNNVSNDGSFHELDNSESAFCVCTSEQPYYIVKCNHAWSSLMGYIPDEVLGTPIFEVLSGPLTEQPQVDYFTHTLEQTIHTHNYACMLAQQAAQQQAHLSQSNTTTNTDSISSPTPPQNSFSSSSAAGQSPRPRLGSATNITHTTHSHLHAHGPHSFSHHSHHSSLSAGSALMYNHAGILDDELRFHVNLTLYKSPDFNFVDSEDWDPSSLEEGDVAAYQPHNGHHNNIQAQLSDEENSLNNTSSDDKAGNKRVAGGPPRRRVSFHAQRDSLYSLHAYPIRRRQPNSVTYHNQHQRADAAVNGHNQHQRADAAVNGHNNNNGINAHSPELSLSPQKEQQDTTTTAQSSTVQMTTTTAAGSTTATIVTEERISVVSRASASTTGDTNLAQSPGITQTHSSSSLVARFGSLLSPKQHSTQNTQIQTQQAHMQASQHSAHSLATLTTTTTNTQLNTQQPSQQPIVLLAILFSEIKPRQPQRTDTNTHDSSGGLVRNSLRLALESVGDKIRNSFNSTSSAQTQTHITHASALDISNNNIPHTRTSGQQTHRRSFQMKPHRSGSFSSFRSDNTHNSGKANNNNNNVGSQSDGHTHGQLLTNLIANNGNYSNSSESNLDSPGGPLSGTATPQRNLSLARPSSVSTGGGGGSRPTSVSEYKYDEDGGVLHLAASQGSDRSVVLNEVYSPLGSTTPRSAATGSDYQQGPASVRSSGRTDASSLDFSTSPSTIRNSGRASLGGGGASGGTVTTPLAVVAEDEGEDRDSMRSSSTRPSLVVAGAGGVDRASSVSAVSMNRPSSSIQVPMQVPVAQARQTDTDADDIAGRPSFGVTVPLDD